MRSTHAVKQALLLSASILLGFERGNIDLLVLALVAGAALIYADRGLVRPLGTIALIGTAMVLKLYPAFCINLVARFGRTSCAVAAALIAILAVYLVHISGLPGFHLEQYTKAGEHVLWLPRSFSGSGLLAQLSGLILFGGLAFVPMLSFFDAVLLRRQSALEGFPLGSNRDAL